MVVHGHSRSSKLVPIQAHETFYLSSIVTIYLPSIVSKI